jgi:hypothetical protein
MNREQLRIAIITILKNSSRPLKAKEIRAAYCKQNRQPSVTVSDINSILYSELRNIAKKDESTHSWTVNTGGSTRARRHRRNDSGRERAKQHIEEASKLSELLGGTDVDVKEYFFNLSEGELKIVLDEYERTYGGSKREYAEYALPAWKRGTKQMSGLVAERLFNLLPPRMPLPTKYEMVRTLWEKYGPRSDATLVIGPDCDPVIAVEEIERQILDSIKHYNIPKPMENRFTWLSSDDVTTRQVLLNHFLDEEKKLIATDARTRTQIILRHFEQGGYWTETIKQVYEIGNHRVELFFDFRASGIQKGRPARPPSPTGSHTKTRIPESSGCAVVAGAILTIGVLACLCIGLPWA